MPEFDVLQRFLFDKAPVRGEFIKLSDSYKNIVEQHNYPESVRKILGEALCAVGLLSAIIKFEGRLTLQFRGSGKLKLLLAQCDDQFQIRGLVQCDHALSYDELLAEFTKGTLGITVEAEKSKTRYQGVVEWQGNSLAESLEGYFERSEQLATKIMLGVNETHAAGFLLQVLPAQNDNQQIDEQVVQPHWEHLAILTNTLKTEEILTVDYITLLKRLYPEEDVRVFPSQPVTFKCTCSRKRSANAIYILGKEEADAELEGKNSLVVTCDFCNEEYVFDKVEVEQIFKGNTSPPDAQLH